MRIVHVVPTYLPAVRYGGPIWSVHGLCAALARRGHQVDVVTTSVDGPVDSDVPLRHRVDMDGVGVHYFRSRVLRRAYYSFAMYRFLSRAMRTWDVVHTHSTFLFPTAAAAHLARRDGVPYVLSPRGMLVRELIERKNRLMKKAWIGLVERRNVAHAAAIHVTSALEASELQGLGLGARVIFEIPNGVDHSLSVAPGTSASTLPSGYMLCLGRINWKKGIDRIMHAMPLQRDSHLVIAGNDEEGYKDTLLALAQRLGIAPRVTFRGFVQGAEKAEILQGASLLALASTSENFGNVVLEAMVSGVPVVVTPEVGLAPLVARTSSGIVASGDAPSLAAAMDRILGSVEERERMGRNGRIAAAPYTWASVAERMEAQYLAIVAAGGT